jgi:UDP-N-acetylmuramate dehydrogenase
MKGCMQILNNVTLKPFNTFGIDAKASFFVITDHPDQVQGLIKSQEFSNIPKLILGGGSNILFKKDFEGLVLKINFTGITHTFINSNQVIVTAGAGENWDALVQFCVNNNWGGLENLSLIPGSVGAAPIQNIGAYGVELKDVFSHLHALDLQTFETRRFANEECDFAYRNSVFKNAMKNRFLITSVSFILNTKPRFNLSYPALLDEINKSGGEITLQSVADAVVRIRRSKLPDPEHLGNAGSFFKNPVVDSAKFNTLKSDYPLIPSFFQQDGLIKIPAAWLIEQCGWKGKRYGDAGVHAYQPLVLVNYGLATGVEILNLAGRVRESVFNRFNILLEAEVNII